MLTESYVRVYSPIKHVGRYALVHRNDALWKGYDLVEDTHMLSGN